MANTTFPTKHAQVLFLLSRLEGASIADIQAATGWQHNSTRGMLTGLRKRGFGIESERVDGVRRYILKSRPERF
jgi:DNA-binding IclR family transcriptional regulator